MLFSMLLTPNIGVPPVVPPPPKRPDVLACAAFEAPRLPKGLGAWVVGFVVLPKIPPPDAGASLLPDNEVALFDVFCPKEPNDPNGDVLLLPALELGGLDMMSWIVLSFYLVLLRQTGR